MITVEPKDQEMLFVQNSEGRCLKLRVQIIFWHKKQMLIFNFVTFWKRHH